MGTAPDHHKIPVESEWSPSSPSRVPVVQCHTTNSICAMCHGNPTTLPIYLFLDLSGSAM